MTADVDVYRDLRIPMRDGVHLVADLYLPSHGSGPHPALVTRTAYGKNGFLASVSDFSGLAARGYAVIVQDKRGRFGSEGEWRILRDDSAGERRDGFDTVEWIAAQEWCTGDVGVFGLSYLGHTAMGAAVSDPPHLRAGVSMQPSTDEYTDRTFVDGVLNLQNIVDWASSQLVASTIIDKLPDADRARVRAELEEHLTAGPDRYARLPLSGWPFFGDFPYLWEGPLAHREDPEYFAESRIDEAEAAAITVPLLHVGGWFDFFPRNTVRQFELSSALSRAGAHQRLVVGPWLHGQLTREDIGGVSHPGSAVDTNTMLHDWFGSWLDGSGAVPADARALIYVLGANRWRAEQEWPIRGTVETSLHLGPAGELSGTPVEEGTRTFFYDPRAPYSTPGVTLGPVDVSAHHAGDGVLVYRTEPLTEELEVTGWPKVVIQASTSGTDADWLAEVNVVGTDGVSRIVNEGIARARYRHGRTSPQPAEPGVPTEYTIGLRPMSIVFQPGERIELVITGGKFPVYERNPNAFVDLNEYTESDLVTARNEVHSGGATRSRLVLPVIPADARGEWIPTPWPAGETVPSTLIEHRGDEL